MKLDTIQWTSRIYIQQNCKKTSTTCLQVAANCAQNEIGYNIVDIPYIYSRIARKQVQHICRLQQTMHRMKLDTIQWTSRIYIVELQEKQVQHICRLQQVCHEGNGYSILLVTLYKRSRLGKLGFSIESSHTHTIQWRTECVCVLGGGGG